MLNVVLFEPEIPPNTGNIIRLCANSGARLHLVEPLGFSLRDREMRRAGLDYRETACLTTHDSLDACLAALGAAEVFAFTTRASTPHARASFVPESVLLFGPESRGLPQEILDRFDEAHRLRLPMVPDSRSLNLSNAVAVAVYEAWRQLGFAGAAGLREPT